MKRDTIIMLCTKQRFMFERFNGNSPIVPKFFYLYKFTPLLETVRAVVKNHQEEWGTSIRCS